MKFEIRHENDDMLPPEVLVMVENEVEKAVLPIKEEDSSTAEYLREMEISYKKGQCLFLTWLKKNFAPQKVLYAGSGSDVFPKYIFGEGRVFHTSMEGYKPDESRYFPSLGKGIKIISDNEKLSFDNSVFDLILFFGLATETISDQIRESTRVLKDGGLIGCDSIVAENIDFEKIIPGFKQIDFPENNLGGVFSDLKFFTFLKC